MNCAAVDKLYNNPYHQEGGITGYHEFDGRDTIDYPIVDHFPAAYRFLDEARKKGMFVVLLKGCLFLIR